MNSLIWVSPNGSSVEIPDDVVHAVERLARQDGVSPADYVYRIIAEHALARVVEQAESAQRLELTRTLLAQGPVLVHLRPSAPGLDVPAHLRDQPGLALRIGYSLDPPIHDLVVDELGVRGTLLFGDTLHHCVMPWSAIVGLTSEAPRVAPPAPATPTKRGAHLKLV